MIFVFLFILFELKKKIKAILLCNLKKNVKHISKTKHALEKLKNKLKPRTQKKKS